MGPTRYIRQHGESNIESLFHFLGALYIFLIVFYTYDRPRLSVFLLLFVTSFGQLNLNFHPCLLKMDNYIKRFPFAIRNWKIMSYSEPSETCYFFPGSFAISEYSEVVTILYSGNMMMTTVRSQ